LIIPPEAGGRRRRRRRPAQGFRGNPSARIVPRRWRSPTIPVRCRGGRLRVRRRLGRAGPADVSAAVGSANPSK